MVGLLDVLDELGYIVMGVTSKYFQEEFLMQVLRVVFKGNRGERTLDWAFKYSCQIISLNIEYIYKYCNITRSDYLKDTDVSDIFENIYKQK